ncbi:hypothetical protein [Glaciimonas immobilis]|uniref:HipA-like C-terminal domain-containing protein n=1 Tax=Glaciimonas immobilis TaxID=728004 RepID=A0A840RPJ2_9BURK|nr:hypothetical protein [Glaciimonas immobilis]KAF3999189.1 hypothetical protein HAV38_04430 [Glaciimonas immobilis]MBB5198644.1 hypothetical protein [Glaciimonas immobilis]
MSQQPLFEIEVKQLIPNGMGSADLRYIAIGADGHEYAAKESSIANPSLPAAEYLGYCFSARCQIAVPATATLVMQDGTFALGSRFEGGVGGFSALMPIDQSAALAACAAELSALLTLDIFLANDDRHGGNFLSRRLSLTGKWSMIAIDFSRAMWMGGFPKTDVSHTRKNGNTANTIQLMKNSLLWDNGRSSLTASALGAITPQLYGNWVAAMPPSWVNKEVAESVGWWASAERTQRISDLIACL